MQPEKEKEEDKRISVVQEGKEENSGQSYFPCLDIDLFDYIYVRTFALKQQLG